LNPLHSEDAKSEVEILRGRQALLILLFAFLLGIRALVLYLDNSAFPDLKYQVGPKKTTLPTRDHKMATTSGEKRPSFHAKKKPPVVPLNINKATRDELMTLPGIGAVLAERIVAYREEKGPFADTSEIKEVSGIGEKRFEGIKDWIRTR
jgi:competence ComEA-like helix-hairpin-helix protein